MRYFLLFILVSTQIFAIDVFDQDGLLSLEYKKSKLTSGAVFKLREDLEVEVNRFLGAGNTTDIYSVTRVGHEGEYALRLPKNDPHYIYSTNQLYPILEHYNVEIPKRYTGRNSNFILTEVVDISFDMTTLFEEVLEGNDKKLISEASEALKYFFKNTAMFESIGDFNGSQLVYSKKNKKWILLDWINSYQLFNPFRNQVLITKENITILDQSKVLSDKAVTLLEEIKILIKDERVVLEEIDEGFYNSLSTIDSGKFKEAINFKWNTTTYKEKFKEEYLINKLNTIKNLDLSKNDFRRIREMFKFYDSESAPLLTLQIRMAKTKKEFIESILMDNSLFSFAKREILDKSKEHFIELGGTLEEINEIQKLLDKDFSTCKESMKLFF